MFVWFLRLAAGKQRCNGGGMPSPRIRVHYRIAKTGEIPDGKAVHIDERPGRQADILIDPLHTPGTMLPAVFTRLCSHLIVHGSWRQRWTDDDRMRRPAQGLGLAVSRWEAVPARRLPRGQIVFGLSQGGSCIWLIDDRFCTEQLVDDMNNLLLRLAGDGLWIQVWFSAWPPRAALPPRLPVSPSATSLVTV